MRPRTHWAEIPTWPDHDGGRAALFDLNIRSFYVDVVWPALSRLDAEIVALAASGDVGDAFAHSDMLDLRRQTLMAFTLAVQSIWERQLRTYLEAVVGEVEPEHLGQVHSADWARLQKIWLRVRGVDLTRFAAFDELDVLQRLGSACRHGEGTSAVALRRLNPEFWPSSAPVTTKFDAFLGSVATPRMAAEDIEVPLVRLRGFVEAIMAFWRDVEVIRINGFSRKAPSVERHLERIRLHGADVDQDDPLP